MSFRRLDWTGLDLQLLVIFICIVVSLGGSTTTTTCPTTRETSDSSKWLLYGMPPKCFPAGLRGPCDPNQVLVPTPTSVNSGYGVCTTNNSIQYQKGDIMSLKSDLRNSRGKRETRWLRKSSGSWRNSGSYGSANGIRRNGCSGYRTYNSKLRRCSNSRSKKLLRFIKR
ncbi:unnamed protein product [Orchesella dallaii]|uniref:Uncharacterized protein n=1 Tax=Orchesella dallaii TaxID=48710 RepID=A0ABP1PM34_9HEXA